MRLDNLDDLGSAASGADTCSLESLEIFVSGIVEVPISVSSPGTKLMAASLGFIIYHVTDKRSSLIRYEYLKKRKVKLGIISLPELLVRCTRLALLGHDLILDLSVNVSSSSVTSHYLPHDINIGSIHE